MNQHQSQHPHQDAPVVRECTDSDEPFMIIRRPPPKEPPPTNNVGGWIALIVFGILFLLLVH